MKRIVSTIEAMTTGVGFIGALVVVPLVLCACYEVFSRYFLHAPTLWAFEVGYMLTGANFMLGMGFALRTGSHIRIDALYQHFSPRIQAVVDLLTYAIIVIPVCSWLSFAMAEHALNSFASGETTGQSAWNPIIWPFRAVQAFGVGVLALQAIASLIRAARLVCEEPGKNPTSADLVTPPALSNSQ